MATDSFIIHIKTEDFNKDIANDEVDRPLPKRMNKKVTELMKDELGEIIVT